MYSSEAFAQRAVTVINQHADAHTAEDGGTAPLFLFMPFTVPHTPLQAPSVRCDDLDLTAVQTIYEKASTLQRYNSSNTGRVNPFRVRFANMVTAMDAAVGEVVAALRARNMYENTLMVSTVT